MLNPFLDQIQISRSFILLTDTITLIKNHRRIIIYEKPLRPYQGTLRTYEELFHDTISVEKTSPSVDHTLWCRTAKPHVKGNWYGRCRQRFRKNF